MPDLYATIRTAVADAVGISVNATLTPLAGGRYVLPPTYADAPHRHNMTQPDASGVAAWVSIDSAASFANRMEEQLRRGDFGIDPLRVQVAGRTLSTLQLPHRAYDAILRDSSLDGQRFRDSEIGRAVIAASADDSSALLRYDPSVLLFGGWDSTGLHGNKGQERKWPAAVSVEIHGCNALPIQRAGGRIDPLGITLDAGRVIREGASYRLVGEGEKAPPGAERPSEINHGNIAPTLSPKGVLVEEIRLRGALSLSRLRRYRFGADAEFDVAARTALTLIGLYGIAAVIDDGLDLRRDCELVAAEVAWAIRGTGREEPLAFTLAQAREALRRALAEIPLAAPVVFKADDNLEQLVARSH